MRRLVWPLMNFNSCTWTSMMGQSLDILIHGVSTHAAPSPLNPWWMHRDSFLKPWVMQKNGEGFFTLVWRVFSKGKAGSKGHRTEEMIIALGLCQVQYSGSVDRSAGWIDLPGHKELRSELRSQGNPQVTTRVVNQTVKEKNTLHCEHQGNLQIVTSTDPHSCSRKRPHFIFRITDIVGKFDETEVAPNTRYSWHAF